MKLSDRLQLIADEINTGETMADIGTDHGFLPLYLLDSGKCPHVIMADISSGSLKKAEENCKNYNNGKDYDLRLGNGIDVLENGEVDAVVIAGMGGLLIADILGWNLEKSRTIRKYILQPRNNPGRLRNWLAANGFAIVKESLVREGKFLCEILTVESGRPEDAVVRPYGAADDYPESLLDNITPLTRVYLENRLETETRIYDRIMESGSRAEVQTKDVLERMHQLQHLLEKLESQEQPEQPEQLEQSGKQSKE